MVDGDHRVAILARKNIRDGDELFYNYHYEKRVGGAGRQGLGVGRGELCSPMRTLHVQVGPNPAWVAHMARHLTLHPAWGPTADRISPPHLQAAPSWWNLPSAQGSGLGQRRSTQGQNVQ